MSDPFVAEIRIFPFNFAPKFWAFCDGQLMPLSQNTALFSLLGTTYGGNGTTNFALPNLQGAAPMFFGQGPGLTLHDPGESGGTATVALQPTEMPAHAHALQAADVGAGVALQPSPAEALAARARNANIYSDQQGGLVAMHPAALSTSGGGQPHNNMMPYLTLNFCIALQGVYPTRP